MDEFDLVVIGGGNGGYTAAIRATQLGLTAALIERDKVGGTCLHRGCIPAKELLQTAEVLRTVSGAGDFGVTAGTPSLDLAVTQRRKQAVVDNLAKGTETLLRGRKVEILTGTGAITDAAAHRVRVGDLDVEGDALIVATGSVPRPLPGIDFDGERVLHSDHVLLLDEVPGEVVIIGGGAIGCEFASYLVDVGSNVTLLEALPSLLPGVDKAAAQVVSRALGKRGVTVRTGVTVTGVEANGRPDVAYEDKDGAQKLPADRVIVSIGRVARSEAIAGTGIDLTEGGQVRVDELMRTNVAGVFAVGDVTPGPQLAHVGFAEAIVAIMTILGEPAVPVDYEKVPWGIYCHPEVAFSGITEAEAKERGHDVVTSTQRFGGNSRAQIMGETDGLVKIVAERDGAVLGVHVVGPWATELLAEGYLAVNWEASPAEVGALIHPHPTLSEAMGEAALALTGRKLH
ncbi:MAG: dihydrolipoyl dehydrogenase [Acidimicrobiia bacterium]